MKQKRNVFIDPGHRNNRWDYGAVGPTGLRESEVVLFVAHCAKAALEQEYDVLMSRYSEDQLRGISERASMANSEAADIFVSIHANAHGDPTAHGVEVLHWPRSKQGIRLAERILPRLVSATADRSRGLKPRNDLGVLRLTSMPAVLVELPFISHPHWESQMRNCEFRLACARAIVEGIRAYFEELIP